MRFEETDMQGPFSVTTVSEYIDRGYIGVYVLSRDALCVHYVGRGDYDLQGRLKTSISEGSGYRVFWFCYESSPMQAYKRECYLYHKYDPPDNSIHPAVPPGTNWRCPVPGCQWGD